MADGEWRQAPSRTAWTKPGFVVQLAVSIGPRSQSRLLKALDFMAWLTNETELVKVFVDRLPDQFIRENDEVHREHVLGQCLLGQMHITLTPRLFSNFCIDDDEEFMPMQRQTSKLLYVLAHEWGHGRDRRSFVSAYAQSKCKVDGLPVGCTDHRESYAEAYAEWYLSRGQTTNEAARWYARVNGWRRSW